MEKRKRIPKDAFDMEYATNWLREVDFLKGRNIFPTYQKNDQ